MKQMSDRITFPTFLDYVTANGPTKLSRVRTAQSMYASEFKVASWYLGLRKAIDAYLGGGGDAAFVRCLQNANERKLDSYEAVIKGLRRWMKGKRLTAFAAEPRNWTSAGLTVAVNPTGLLINGEPHVVHFYFKDAPLDQHRVNPLLHLLDQSHGDLGKPVILDCRRSKAYGKTRRVKDVDAYLETEARSFLNLWATLAA